MYWELMRGKNEMGVFQDFLSEGKTGLNFNFKREGI